MIRNIAAGIVGVIVAVGLVALIESAGHMVYPPPDGLDFSDPEVMRPYIATLPIGALLFVLCAWFIGTFAGTLIASFTGTAKSMIFAAVIGGLIMAASIANMIMIPHPLWFSVIALAGIAASAWLGQRLASARGRSGMPDSGD